MKHLLLSLIAIGFVGCASSEKKEAAKPAAPAAAPATAAKPAAETTQKTVKAAAQNAAGATVCMYEDVRREIAIVETADRCAVEYTKDGEKKEIGSGLPKSPVCQSVADKVRTNLETAGYKCE